MIKHILRQELNGGYWFIRDHGRAIQLNSTAYKLMACIKAADGKAAESDKVALLQQVPDGQHDNLWDLLIHYGLHTPKSWESMRHIPCNPQAGTHPVDAVIAPKRIYFEITRGCNLACHSCFNNSHFQLSDELTLGEILDINRQAYEMGVFEMRYTGGECTTVAGFPKIIADAQQRGFYISIGTNGVYTDEQLEWLPTSGIDWFIISLDGDRETNDSIRGKGTYDHVLNTLNILADYPAIKVRLNMVVARHNLSAIEVVAQVAVKYGVSTLNLIPLRPYGRSLKKMSNRMFTQAGFYQFIHEVNRLRLQYPALTFSTTIDLLNPEATTSLDLIVQKKRTCAAGVEACVIGPQGHVYGCSYSPASFPDSADEEGKRIFIAGNMRDDSLETIWRDSQRWTVFRDLTQYKNPKCHTCSHYSVRCSGSCQIMAWYQHQSAAGKETGHIRDYYDPYCFVDLLQEPVAQVTASTAATHSQKG